MIFFSQELPGACMNKFGMVFAMKPNGSGGFQLTFAELADRDQVWREALAGGCTKVDSGDDDLGLVWQAAEHRSVTGLDSPSVSRSQTSAP